MNLSAGSFHHEGDELTVVQAVRCVLERLCTGNWNDGGGETRISPKTHGERNILDLNPKFGGKSN